MGGVVLGVRLPRATLIVAEKVTEQVDGSLRDALHVFDAAVIAGDDVRRLPYSERRRRLGLLVEALDRDQDVLRQSVGGGGGGGWVDEAADAAVKQNMPIRLKQASRLSEQEYRLLIIN